MPKPKNWLEHVLNSCVMEGDRQYLVDRHFIAFLSGPLTYWSYGWLYVLCPAREMQYNL